MITALVLGSAMDAAVWVGRVAGEPPVKRARPAQDTPAVAIYCRQCQSCHGRDGAGSRARGSAPDIPDFNDRSWQESRSDAALLFSIRNGRGAMMPDFADRLGAAEAQALVAYVRRFNPPRSKPAAISADEFDRRFDELQDELQELRRQFQELHSRPSGK
jgi:mono/diheme cytochrome c family protein